MDFVPASDEEDISFPAPVATPKNNLLEDPYSFEALVAAAPRRPTLQAAQPPYKPPIAARPSPGARPTCQSVESISYSTEEQPATHCGNQAILPPSIAEFPTAPPAQSTSKAHKHPIYKSSLTSLGPTPGERHTPNSDEFQPPPFPVIDISDDSEYDGDPKAKGKRPKQDQKPRKPTEKKESTSKAPLKSESFTNQAESETMHQVEMGIEREILCDSKPPPRKRKAPVETAQDEPPKKKARKSPRKKLFDCDLALPSLPCSTVLVPPVAPKDTPSFLDAASAHPKRNVVEPSENIVPPPPKKSKRAKKVVTDCGVESTPEAELTIELKVTESGVKKGKSRNVPVVDSEHGTAGADASPAVPHRDELALSLPYKLKPVIELTKSRSKKKVVQSDEEVDLADGAFVESEDELQLLIQSTSTARRAKATSKNPAPKGDKRGKNNASHAKPTSGETLAAQIPGPGPMAELPKQLGTSTEGAWDVAQGEAGSLFIPHDFAVANSNSPLPPLRDINNSSNELPSANPRNVATEPPTPKLKRPSMGHMIPKRKDSMASILQRAGLHAPLSSSRLTVPATARIAPLHVHRKTPPPPPLPVPKPKKKVESEEETDEEEYLGLNERQITKLKEEKRKRAWYSP